MVLSTVHCATTTTYRISDQNIYLKNVGLQNEESVVLIDFTNQISLRRLTGNNFRFWMTGRQRCDPRSIFQVDLHLQGHLGSVISVRLISINLYIGDTTTTTLCAIFWSYYFCEGRATSMFFLIWKFVSVTVDMLYTGLLIIWYMLKPLFIKGAFLVFNQLNRLV